MSIILNCFVVNTKNKKTMAFYSVLTKKNFKKEITLLFENLIEQIGNIFN